MGILREMYHSWKEKRAEAAREFEEMDDDKTTDGYLRSLRRWRRKQDEEVEKQNLVREIRQYEHDRTNKYLWGVVKQNRQKKALNSKYMLMARPKKEKNNVKPFRI